MASDGVGKRAGGSCLQGFVEFEGGFYSKFSSRSIFPVLEMWWWGFWKDQRPDWLGSQDPGHMPSGELGLPLLCSISWLCPSFIEEQKEVDSSRRQRSLDTLDTTSKDLWRNQRWTDSGKRAETHGDKICVTWSHSPESHWWGNSVSVFSPTSGSSNSPEERELQNSSFEGCFLGRPRLFRASATALTFTISILERKKHNKLVQAEGRKLKSFSGFSSLFYF